MATSPFVEAFQKLLELLESKPRLKAKVERELPKAKNDADRVAMVAPLLRMIDFSPISTEPEKSESKASKFRELGNQYFSRKDYVNALLNYNASVSVAPFAYNSKTLAFAFANRSVTLKAVGDLKQSIGDGKRALVFGYPEELQHKIFLRIGQCYQLLGQPVEAKVNFLKSKELLAKADVTESKLTELQTQLERDISVAEASIGMEALNRGPESAKIEATVLGPPQVDLAVKSNASKELPAASDCVRLSYNDKYGRHLVAATDINPGV